MEEHLRVRGVEGANLSPTAGSAGLTFEEASPVPPRGAQQARKAGSARRTADSRV